METREYDLIVIGAGPVGENVADRAVQGGLSAVIVESELVGGECSYWACMPSKALLRPGAALRAAAAVGGASEAITGSLDTAAIFARRNAFTSDWHDDGQVAWLASAGIELVRGVGSLSGPREVEVALPEGGTATLRARHAVAVCTGSSALMPPLPGLAELHPWTSREATSATAVPASLVVLGGGVVGVEMATFFATAGCEVSIVAPSGLLPRMEPFAGEAVQSSLEALGVKLLRSRAAAAEPDPAGKALLLQDGSRVVGQEILVATGRSPRSNGLGLDTLGLDGVSDGGWLGVDDTMLVPGTDWLYAVGDINHRALLTHQGKYQARAAGDVIAARAKGLAVDDSPWGTHVATADHAAVPQVVFSEPQIASIGVTAAEAAEAGTEVRIIDYELGKVAGAATHADGYQGTARVVIDAKREVLLGATFVGPDVEELVHAATIAVVGKVPIGRLWHAVPAYPTISEVWLRWLEAYGRPGA